MIEVQQSTIEGLERPATVFLSYAHEDVEAIKELQLRLEVRGILCQRDADYLLSGSVFESEIEHAIEHDADAIVLYITPDWLKSNFIRRVEVCAAWRRHKRDPYFHIVPILQGVSIDELRQHCLDRGMEDLTCFHAIPLHEDKAANNTIEIQQKKWNDAAKRILQAALTLHLRRINADRRYEPWICLKTFVGNSPTTRLDLSLDWLGLVYEKELLPTQQEWENILLPALLDVKQIISEKAPSRRLHIFVQCILPVAIALGFAFRKTARITLLIEGQKEIWSTETPPSERDPLHTEWIDTNQENQQEAVIEVEAAKNRFIEQSVTKALAANALAPGYRIRLSLPDLSVESVRDAAHAQAIAQQVGRVCQEICDQYAVTHIHLFVSVPVELAVLIGYQLNALCPITLYEYGLERAYKPVGTLVSY